MTMKTDLSSTDYINFHCNICGKENEIQALSIEREKPSCRKCGSNVRIRSIIHLLSVELFHSSLPLFDFPKEKQISGIGLSDWEEYAKILTKKLDYKNTFFHKSPRCDIKKIGGFNRCYDFIICSEIFEHIEYPVSPAFLNLRKLLNKTGFVLFTAPYILTEEKTREYFPDLYEYKILRDRGIPILKNITKEGELQIFRDLTFHGGKDISLIHRMKRVFSGAQDPVTVEMRLFSKESLINEFENAGFHNIRFFDQTIDEWGIFWDNPCGLPIIAHID
jgi:hypothetical protein